MSGTLCFLIRLKRKGPAESLTKTKVTNLTNLTKPTKQKEENNSMRKNKSQKYFVATLLPSSRGSKTSIFWQGWIESSSRNREFVGTKKLARRYIQCLGTQDFPQPVREDENSRYANSSSFRNLEFVETKKLARQYIQCLGTQDSHLSFAFHGISSDDREFEVRENGLQQAGQHIIIESIGDAGVVFLVTLEGQSEFSISGHWLRCCMLL